MRYRNTAADPQPERLLNPLLDLSLEIKPPNMWLVLHSEVPNRSFIHSIPVNGPHKGCDHWMHSYLYLLNLEWMIHWL
jgi:hypothetical protein